MKFRKRQFSVFRFLLLKEKYAPLLDSKSRILNMIKESSFMITLQNKVSTLKIQPLQKANPLVFGIKTNLPQEYSTFITIRFDDTRNEYELKSAAQQQADAIRLYDTNIVRINPHMFDYSGKRIGFHIIHHPNLQPEILAAGIAKVFGGRLGDDVVLNSSNLVERGAL